MRIVIDLQSCQNGGRHRGIGRYTIAIAKALVRRGTAHDFRFVLNDAFPGTIRGVRRELEGLIPQDAISVFKVPQRATAADPSNTWRNRAAAIVRAQFLTDLAPDIVFVPSLFEGFWDDFTVSVEPAPYPTAVTLHDFIPLEEPERYLPAPNDLAAYYRKLSDARSADLLIAISRFISEQAVTLLGVSPDRIVTAPNGVDDWFRPPVDDASNRLALMARYGIARPFIFNTSPLEHRKNIEGLIAGFGSMARDVQDRHQLVIAGKMDAYGHRYINSLAAKEGLPEGAVVLPGYVPDDDLVTLYQQCELFAFPSLSEGFGLPVLEAMACGAPVIGSATTSIPEVIGREDLLCDPRDARTIGSAMEWILSDPALQGELRAFGPKRAAEFSWDKTAEITLAALERTAASHRSTTAVVPANISIPEPARPHVALVTSTMAVEHRLAACNSVLMAALATRYDTVLVCPEGTVSDPWIESNHDVRSFAWFERNASSFDHVIYSADCWAAGAFTELMTANPGILILLDRLNGGHDLKMIDRNMPAEIQEGLFAQEGMAGLIEALQNPPSDTGAWLGSALRKAAMATIGEAAPHNDEPAIPSLPLLFSMPAAQAFRQRIGIDDQVLLVAGYATDEIAAEQLLTGFRSSRASREGKAHLMLHVLADPQHGESDAAEMSGFVSGIFGGISRTGAPVSETYRGLVSAADISLFAEDLTQPLTGRLIGDAQAADQPAVATVGRKGPAGTRLIAAEDIASTVDDAAAEKLRKSKPRGLAIAPGLPLLDELAERIQTALEKFTRIPAADAQRAIADLLPGSVRGVRPSGDDLAQVAISIADNEASWREPCIFIDISAFALPGARRRLDSINNALLKAILIAGKGIAQGVYSTGNRFVAANQFVGSTIGLSEVHLQDEVVVIRPGDRIIGIDALAGFQARSLDAIAGAQERGASITYVAVGAAPVRQRHSIDDIAQLILAWTHDRAPSMTSHVCTLVSADTGSREGRAYRLPAAAARLVDAGIAVDCLTIDRSAIITEVAATNGGIVEISPPHSTSKLAALLNDEGKRSRSRTDTSAGALSHVVMGHMLGSYSLAIINRNVARTLESAYRGKVRYLPYETDPINHTEGVPAAEKELMIELAARSASSTEDEVVISQHYPLLVPEGPYRLKLALFAWEESHVPPRIVDKLAKNFDAVISPSHAVTDALVISGLPIPVATIGQPVDTSAYQNVAHARRPHSGKTTFLHVSSGFKRKGVDVLLAAWARAFSADDNVRLVIKTFPNPHNDVEQQVADLRGKCPDLAEIETINMDMERDEVPALYAAADVMVLPSRGEGYNLPALEAMAAGLPLIVTGHGGHKDFCGPAEARMVAYRFARSESHVRDSHAMWVEPDLDDLVAALREYARPDLHPEVEKRRERALAAASDESDQDAWTRRYAATISGLLTYQGAPPRVAWMTSWEVQCGIAQYSGYLFEGMSPQFLAESVVLCDERTLPTVPSHLAFDPIWKVGQSPKLDGLRKAVARHNAEALVIQHQDGLIPWDELGRIGSCRDLDGLVTVTILHNARNLHRVGGDELRLVIEGLSRMTRVVVHNISDVNFLLDLGLRKNVGLLPHGAFASTHAPWPRSLQRDDAPIIGCHGFFFRHKGIDKLIRAAALLRQEWPELRLRLVNARFPSGEHDAIITECRALAEELGMTDAIEWHLDFLPIEQVNALLAGCDLIVLPYDESDDSASGAVRTSLASMVPLVATRVKIFAELEDAAAWVENNDPRLLAETIGPLLRSAEARRNIQAAMHDWLSARDWHRVAGTLEGMIDGLVRQKRLGWLQAAQGREE